MVVILTKENLTMIGIIKLGQQELIDTKLYSWTNEYYYKVPYTGKFDKVRIDVALKNKFIVKSGYRGLRWTEDVSIVSHDAESQTFIYKIVEGLAD